MHTHPVLGTCQGPRPRVARSGAAEDRKPCVVHLFFCTLPACQINIEDIVETTNKPTNLRGTVRNTWWRRPGFGRRDAQTRKDEENVERKNEQRVRVVARVVEPLAVRVSKTRPRNSTMNPTTPRETQTPSALTPPHAGAASRGDMLPGRRLAREKAIMPFSSVKPRRPRVCLQALVSRRHGSRVDINKGLSFKKLTR